MMGFDRRSRLVEFTTAIVLIVLGASVSQGQPSKPLESMSAEEVKAEVKRLKNEIDGWKNSKDAPPQWKEFQKGRDNYNRRLWTEGDELRTLDNRLRELARTSEVQEWHQRFLKLEDRLYELDLLDRANTRMAGERLFRARHAELAKLSVQTPDLLKLGLDALNYPRIDGSTSTQPLAVLITCHCFHASSAWKGAGQSREEVLSAHPRETTNFLGIKREYEADLMEFSLNAVADATTTERLAIIINHLLAANASTNQAYLNLIDGHSELGLLARRPSDTELQHARDAKVELDVQPCALDAFVFLVNEKNPVKNLSIKQIQDIYAGKIKTWNDVGGKDASIIAYQREPDSGSQELMKRLVMKQIPFDRSGDFNVQLVGRLMSSTYLQLTSDENGIGYSVYYYERFMSGSPRTKTIQINGIEANAQTIAARTYPFVSEVFVVTRKGIAAVSPAAKLRAWLFSKEGQSVVRESGYVPLPTNLP
jgi:phosphate transport system substrate-binding protein